MATSTGWKSIEDSRVLLQVYSPQQQAPHGGVVILLHDVDGSLPAPEPILASLCERHGLMAIAPQTGPSWWTDRNLDGRSGPTAQEVVAQLTLAKIQSLWGTKPPLIALLGTGAGGHGALRIAYRKPSLFPITAALRPAIDCHELIDRRMPPPEGVNSDAIDNLRTLYGDPERARQDSAVLHIHPLNWPRHQHFQCPPSDVWWGGADRLRMKLFSLGVPHTCDLETQHPPDKAAEQAIGWIADRLEQESRRIE